MAGFTVDPANNGLARAIFTVSPPYRRPDRLLLHTHGGYWNHVRSIQLICTERVPEHDDLWPSAHYGISAVIDTGTSMQQSSSVHSVASNTASSPSSAAVTTPAAATSEPAAAAAAAAAGPASSASTWDRCVVS